MGLHVHDCRHVAQSLGYQMVDLEAMAVQLPKDDMLDDITHPKPGFLLQVCSTLLSFPTQFKCILQARMQIYEKSLLTMQLFQTCIEPACRV